MRELGNLDKIWTFGNLEKLLKFAGPDLGAGQEGTCPVPPQIVDLGQITISIDFFVLIETTRNWIFSTAELDYGLK